MSVKTNTMMVKTKILLSVGSLFSVVILAISTIAFFNFKSSSVDNYREKLGNEAYLISRSLEQKIGRYFDVLSIEAGNMDIHNERQIDVEPVVEALHFIHDNLGVINAYVGLKNGDTYAASNNGLIPDFDAKSLKREWYLRVFAGEKRIITRPYRSSTGDFVMALAVPVVRDGNIVGALCVNLGLDVLTNFIQELSAENQIYVSRRDGFILASPNSKDIGKNLFEQKPSYRPLASEPVSAHNYQSNDVEYYVVSSLLESLHWNVWSWDTVERIHQSSNYNLQVTAVVAVSLILLSLLIIYFLVVQLVYVPIGGEPKAIEFLLKQIAQGNLQCSKVNKQTVTGVYREILNMTENLRGIVSNINESVEKLNISSSQLADSTSQVTNSSESQTLQLEQTSTAMNEMTVTVAEVAKNAVNASTSADAVNDNVRKGADVVGNVESNMHELVSGIEEVVSVTKRLEKETDSIGSILEVIDSISEQTNLLALNAAIEAARAGEHGRGFAVVADEVRSLANRTKESTSEIQLMINRLQTEATRSVMLMNSNVSQVQSTSVISKQASEALQTIRHSISEIQDMNAQISAAAEEQTYVASEINSSLVKINDLAKVTYSHCEGNSSTSQNLSSLAQSLNQSVETFKL